MTLIACHCVHRHLVDRDRLARLRAAFLAGGERVLDVDDLCAAAADGDEALGASLAEPGAVLAGCHARALRALARRLTGVCAADLRTADLRAPGSPDPAAGLGLPPAPAGQAAIPPPALPARADAWYPLIDADRCSNCGSCLSFCLFGVYSRDAAGAVRVTQPGNCKPNCPACARICPENAILFPKCEDPAINGALLSEEQLRGAQIRLSPEAVRGGDLRARLAARRAASGTPLLRPDALRRRPAPPANGGPAS